MSRSPPGVLAARPTFPICTCPRRRGTQAAGGCRARRDQRPGLQPDTRARRRRPRRRSLESAAQQRTTAARHAGDAQDPPVRRAHAHRATAEKAFLLYAMPRRGSHRHRPHPGPARRRHVLPDLSPARHPDHPRIPAGGHDLPASLQRGRPAQGPPATDHVLEQGGRFLLHLRQPRHPVHPGGRLGHGLGDQGRHAHRLGLDRRRRHRRVGLPHRPHLRPCLPRAGNPQRGQQPVGDLHLPGHRRRRRHHLRQPWRGLRDRLAAGRRQ